MPHQKSSRPRASDQPPAYEAVASTGHGFDDIDDIDSENDVHPGVDPALTERRPRRQAQRKNPEGENERERDYEERRPRKEHGRGSHRFRQRDEERESDFEEAPRRSGKGKGRSSGRSRPRADSRGRDDRYDDDDRYGASLRDGGNRARDRGESRSRSRSRSRNHRSRSRSRSRSRDRYSTALTRRGGDKSKAISRRHDRSRSRSRGHTKRSRGRRHHSDSDGDNDVIKTQRYVEVEFDDMDSGDLRIICKQLECTYKKIRGYCERGLIRLDRQTDELGFRKLTKVVGEDDAARLKKLVDRNKQQKQDQLFSGAGPSRPRQSTRDYYIPPPVPVVYTPVVHVDHYPSQEIYRDQHRVPFTGNKWCLCCLSLGELCNTCDRILEERS